MAELKNPLITSIATNPTPEFNYMEDNSKLPTVFAVNQLLSGMATSGGSNANGLTYRSANELVYCGIYHFTTGGLSDIPSEIESGGMFVVYHERESNNVIDGHEPDFGNSVDAKTGYRNHQFVRQVVWPDGPNFITPFTRTGTLTGNSYTWTDWQTLGGGLQRIPMTSNITAANVKKNVLYYSFSAYTLELPDPTTCTLGTKIGIEQYHDGGQVKYTSGGSTTSMNVYPAHLADTNGGSTDTVIGPNVYIFEVVAKESGGVEWVLDVDNNINTTIEIAINGLKDMLDAATLTWTTELNEERRVRAAADSAEENARIGADTEIRNLIGTSENYFSTASTGTVAAKVKTNAAGISDINSRIGTGFTSSDTVAKAITDANKRITDNAKDIVNNMFAIADINTYKLPLKGRAINVFPRSTDLGASDGFLGLDGKTYTFENYLDHSDMVIVMTATGKKITLPAASGLPYGAKCNIELPGASATIKLCTADDPNTIETFTNDTGHTLLLPLEVTIFGSAKCWTLTVAG